MSKEQDDIKSAASRLQAVISLLGFKSANEFAKKVGIPQSEASHIKVGKRPISVSVAYKIHKYNNSIQIEWLTTGEGEMLKSKDLDENEPLGADYYFPSNLSFLIEMRELNLPSIIPISPQIITDLISGNRRPSLALLIRLREVFDVTIDAMLLYDLRLPENMEHLRKDEDTKKEMEAIQKTLQNLAERMEAMQKSQERMEAEMEVLKQKNESSHGQLLEGKTERGHRMGEEDKK